MPASCAWFCCGLLLTAWTDVRLCGQRESELFFTYLLIVFVLQVHTSV